VSREPLPALPFEAWKETKTTLHLFAQVVGKVRLGLSPRWNHWWNAPLYVSVHGLTTGPIPHRGGALELEFDFERHVLRTSQADGASLESSLRDKTVSEFYRETMDWLKSTGVEQSILARPFDPSKTGSAIPFANDTTHGSYDAEAVHRFWQALVAIDGIFKSFRGRYVGKCSPVHFFWHSFDLAVTRFSGRPVELPDDVDPVTKEAYSHEVSSAGFWPGDDAMPEAAFYSYAAPEPTGLSDETLQPNKAWWQEANGSHLALYRYEDFREASDPAVALLQFLQSSYEAAARRGDWPRDELELSS